MPYQSDTLHPLPLNRLSDKQMDKNRPANWLQNSYHQTALYESVNQWFDTLERLCNPHIHGKDEGYKIYLGKMPW